MKECFVECAELLQFIQHVETGLITISMKEYIDLPPVVSIAWGIYKSEVKKKRDHERMLELKKLGLK